MNKIATIALLALFCLCSQADAAETVNPWQLSLTANYGDWRSSDVDNKGSQVQTFAQTAYQTENWGVAATGRQATTNYTTTAHEDALAISTLTDVNIATYYAQVTGNWIFRGGVDFDLPTGKHAYTNDELSKIIIDPIASDLMILSSYGGGLNIAPHLAAIYQFDKNASAGIGLRYQVNGEFDTTTDVPDDTIDPGDRLLLTANGTLGFTDKDILSTMVIYSQTGNDTQAGEESYRTGDTFILSGRYLRLWNDSLQTILGISYVTQGKNDALDADGVLNAENQNANNNYWDVYIQTIYAHSSRITFLGMAGAKQVTANEYESDNFLFDGGRQQLFIEPGLMYFFSKNMYMTMKFRYSQIADKADGFSEVDATYAVINADLAFVMSF